MKIPPILQRDDPLLRHGTKPVPLSEIGSKKIAGILSDMKSAMAGQKDGVAIAAPQIGVPMKIFMISGKLLREADQTYKGSEDDLVFINPEIIKYSKDKMEVEEGCLSVRWLYGKVKRSAKVTLRAFDSDGKKIERGASGLLAQIFQHEVDHLNGKLFTDIAEEVWEMSEEEIRNLQKNE